MSKSYTACPLCNLWDREPENVLYKDSDFVIMRTKTMKGHEERVMIISRKHNAKIPFHNDVPLGILHDRCPIIFDYTPKCVVMHSRFATIKNHWHWVISDLNPHADDFVQILETPWIDVIETSKVNKYLIGDNW